MKARRLRGSDCTVVLVYHAEEIVICGNGDDGVKVIVGKLILEFELGVGIGTVKSKNRSKPN